MKKRMLVLIAVLVVVAVVCGCEAAPAAASARMRQTTGTRNRSADARTRGFVPNSPSAWRAPFHPHGRPPAIRMADPPPCTMIVIVRLRVGFRRRVRRRDGPDDLPEVMVRHAVYFR